MTAPAHTQNMKDDRYVVSSIQSTTIRNHQQRSYSFKPPVVKHLRRHRHRPLNTKQYRRSNNRLRSTTTRIIHITVRPTTNNTHPSEKKSIRPNETFRSLLTNLTARHPHSTLNKSSTVLTVVKNSNKVKHPSKAITINSNNNSPVPQSSKNSWYNEDSTQDLTKRTELVSSNYSDIKTKKHDGCPDWTTFENGHQRNTKKKKKYTRLCVVLSIVAILLIIITTVILAVLLTKSTTDKAINRTAVLRWNSTGITVAGVTGRRGNASNLLNFPFGITLDYSNTLYISDTYNNRIQKYLFGASSGTTIAGQANGTTSTTSFYLSSPCDVAVDSSGDVYVVDTLYNRIQYWSNGSSSGITIAGNGSLGNAINQLDNPYSIFRDPNSGILYISDTYNYRVLRLIPGESSGTIVAGGHGGGWNSTQLSTALGLYFDSVSNSILIANAGTNSIVQWTLGASSWTLVAGSATGSSGSTSTALSYPVDVTLDPMGNVYVADTNNHRIQFFSVGQSTGETIAGVTSTTGNSSILFIQPLSVTLDSQLNLYVSDSGNNRIQKFLRY